MDTIKTPTKQEMFPGLTEEQIQKIEDYTSNLSGVEKQQKQQALYNAYIDKQKSSNISNSRVMTENELYSKSLQEKDPKQKNYLQSNVRQEQLADIVKEKYNLRADASTQEVINGVMQQANDMGVSIDSLNKYLAGESDDFLYEMGFKEKGFWEEVGEVGKNVGAGLLDSALSIPRMVAGAGNFTGRRLASKVKGVDMDELPYNGITTAIKGFADDDSKMAKAFGVDEESTSYQVGKIGGDIAQTAIGGGLAKGAIKNAPGIIGKAGNLLNGAKGTLGKMLAGGIEGAGDMTLYSIIADNKLPSREETGIGGAIGAAIPGLGAVFKATKNALKEGASKFAKSLEVNGIINPARLETVRSQLLTEGAKFPGKGTPEDVGKWMLERGIKGDENQIVKQLTEHAEKSKGLVDDLLATSTSKHDMQEVTDALQMLYEDYSKTPGLQNKAQEIASKIKNEYTISEMNEVKRYMDEAYNMFKMNGGETAGLKAEGLREIRKNIKNKIEDVAESEGLGNIKLLNNETQVARGLADGISRKYDATMIRNFLSPYESSTMGALVGSAGGGIGGIIGGIIGKLANTKSKTWLANKLAKIGGIEKKEITEYLASNGQKALSPKSEEALLKIVGEDKELSEAVNNEINKITGKDLGKKTLIIESADKKEEK